MRKVTLSLSTLLAMSGPALADATIGSATLIEKNVEGLAGERSLRLKIGDAVYFNELLTTDIASRGKFIFDDRTTLQMGPSSQVRLDNFVYANTPAVAFNVTRGAFRFMSAPGAHKPYEVRTHNASIGVRGTSFGVRSIAERTDAVLYDGAIEVCLPNGGACRSLDKPCTTVSVTPAGFVETRAIGANDWRFDDDCRPQKEPRLRRRHGAAEPPDAPTRRAVTKRAVATHAAAPEPHTAPIMRAARLTPQREATEPRPPRRRPQRRADYSGPEEEVIVDAPPPRFGRPFYPPIFDRGPFRPHFPGHWGGNFPRGPHDGGYGGGFSRGGGFRRF